MTGLRQNTDIIGFAMIALYVMCGFSPCVHAGLSAVDSAQKSGLVPHKALYDIRLSARRSSARVANITGKMFYEWVPACDAWTSRHRFDMTYEYLEAPAVRVTSDFATHESFDGKDFNFTLQRRRGGDLFEEIRGSAGADKAVYAMPDGLTFDLPKGTLFPTAHTLAVLDKIKSGAKFYKATLFDGSDAEGPVDINSFIAGPDAYTPPPDGSSPAIDENLLKARGWKLRLAFFPLQTSDAASDYEMSVVFHENGVMSNMDIDYGDFSITQTLRALEPLEESCPHD